jgi:hypothetical protein
VNEVMKVFPSYALSSGLLYSSSKQLLNKTREYTAAEIFNATSSNSAQILGNIQEAIDKLPRRTNITLESFEISNMGGDMIALAFHFIFGILIMIIVETGVCLICSNARSKR